MNALVLNHNTLVKNIDINDKTVGFIYIVESPALKELPLGWTLTDDKKYHLALILTDGTYYIDKISHLTFELAQAAAPEFVLRATQTLLQYYGQ